MEKTHPDAAPRLVVVGMCREATVRQRRLLTRMRQAAQQTLIRA
jgi:hypothetical protein